MDHSTSQIPPVQPSPADRFRRGLILLTGVGAPLLSLILVLALGSILSFTAHRIPSVYRQDDHVTLSLCRLMPGLNGCQPNTGLLTGRQISDLSNLVSVFVGPALNLLLTFGASAWATRRTRTTSARTGLWVGLISALTGLSLMLIFEVDAGFTRWVQGGWNLSILFLTVGSGWFGGVVGHSSLVGREALSKASRAIAAASSPQVIVAAIGEHLADQEVSQISLWQAASPARTDTSGEIILQAAWAPRGKPTPSTGLRLTPAQIPSLGDQSERSPLLLQAGKTSPIEQMTLQSLGPEAILLLPLSTSGGQLNGALMIGSSSARGLKRSIWRIELISAQVSLALENLRLVEAARQAAVLQERQRLAGEIHDTLAQGFTSIVMHLETAEARLNDEAASGTTVSGRIGQGHQADAIDLIAEVRGHLDQAMKTARESLDQARRLVWALQPEVLERAPLATAVERVVTCWSQENDIAASTTITGIPCSLHPEVEVTLLRATQEALTNIRKHAKANQVSVTLSYMHDLIVLDVQDNGVGFDSVHTQKSSVADEMNGFGLTSMRQRVERLGGRLLVESTPKGGTTLVVEIPLPVGKLVD